MNTFKTQAAALCLIIMSQTAIGNTLAPITTDTDDSGANATGDWKISAGANPHEGESLYSTGNTSSYRWDIPIATAGEYDLRVWWTYYDNRTQAAQYKFNTQSGTKSISINQRNATEAGQWVSLGRHSLAKGTTTITVNNPGGSGTLSADAVQAIGNGETTVSNPSGAITVDTSDSDATATGKWITSAGTNPYDGDSVYSVGSSSNYRWAIPVAAAGEYDIRVWWTYYDNRTQAAQYEFNTQDGTKSVNVNQRNGNEAGQWVSLGLHNLAKGTTTITVTNPDGSGTLSADAVQIIRNGNTVDEPVVDEPIIDEPVVDEPVVDEPVIDEPPKDPINGNTFVDDFTGLDSFIGYVTNNPDVLPDVSYYQGRYHAVLRDNPNDITLHFRKQQGRLDAKQVSFPFKVIARNIGIGRTNNSQQAPLYSAKPYIFAGLQVHVTDLNSFNSSHVVVGHRGGTYSTVEGKNTVNGVSYVNDEGQNVASNARADIMIEGTADRKLIVSWQPANSQQDNWKLYKGTGNLPGVAPSYGSSVYVGLITYAQGTNGLPFVGTADKLIIED